MPAVAARGNMEIAQATLHRYFIWANRLRMEFEKALETERTDLANIFAAEPSQPFLFFLTDAGAFMSLWYAALYVVVEGWQELGLCGGTIDELLLSPNTALLKRYRNGVCHFQESWLDDRMKDFCASEHSAAWVHALHEAFGAHFLRMYPGR
jgi:hypothetical protein